eukprot:525890_1
MEYADYLVHSVRENVYTSNLHYLTDTTKSFETQIQDDFQRLSTKYKADMRPHFDIVCGIRAFFKTRKKMLPDTIQLHFTKALSDLFKRVEQEIEKNMTNQKSLDMIKESPRSVARRTFNLEREKKISAALEEISLL